MNAYYAYGKRDGLFTSPGINTLRKEFTGKEYDDEGGDGILEGMGLYYLGARYYDPKIIRWISVDPVPQLWDMYNYCGGDPINRFDPDGKQLALEKMDPFSEKSEPTTDQGKKDRATGQMFGWLVTPTLKASLSNVAQKVAKDLALVVTKAIITIITGKKDGEEKPELPTPELPAPLPAPLPDLIPDPTPEPPDATDVDSK